MNNQEGSNHCEATTSGFPSTSSEIVEETIVDIIETFYSCNSSPLPHFEDESRDCVRLYKAALEGDWNEAYSIMRTRNEIVKEPINNKWDTALHIAVAAKHKDFVRNLLGEMYNMNNLCEAAPTGTPSTYTEIMERNEPSNSCNSSLPLHIHDKSEDGIRLYKAALKGDWNKADTIICKRNEMVRIRINNKCDTALHIAVAAKHTNFVRNLLGKMHEDDLALPNNDSNTSLCFAAASGVIEIAEMLIEKNPKLPDIPGSKHLTPIHMAALFGRGEMVRYLKNKTKFEELDNSAMRNLFLAIISADIYDVALWMFRKTENTDKEVLNHSPNGREDTALHLLARKPTHFKTNFFQNLANSIYNAKMPNLAHQLVEELWESVKLLPEEKVTNLLKSPSRLLFDAAESGNFDFLVILIRSNPDFIWKANDKGLSLFHVAALYRHRNIFNIIYELKGIKDFIAPYTEEETKNNLLHLVAYLPPTDRVQVVSGAALQMQRELLWFQAAKGIVPLSYIKTRNKKGELPHELFTTQHENLRKEGEKWMKETATACMLVATLIATVVFAAAFTLPGGNESKEDKKLGFPQFRKKFWFDMFITSDSVSLLTSVTAIIIFLSILTSRYAEDDFRTTLPRKLMFGILALFVSIIFMVLAFTAAMILIRDNEPMYSLILIICLAILPAVSFAWSQYSLWLETFRSAFFSEFFFRGRQSGIFL